MYDPIEDWVGIPKGLLGWVWKAIAFSSTVDLYCPRCESMSVFSHPKEPQHPQRRVENATLPEYDPRHQSQIKLTVTYTCARSAEHMAWFDLLLLREKTLIKTGQYPSLADTAEHGLGKYRKVLGDERQRELNLAVGLRAHGVGIGSLIYLRRALEFIVASAEKTAVAELGAAPFDSNERMSDKIKALQAYLPEFLVEQRTFYGVLSDGIHNRSENECKAMFAPCLEGIRLALDQMVTDREKRERTAIARAGIEAIAGQIKDASKAPG